MTDLRQALEAHPFIADLQGHQFTLLEGAAELRRVFAGQFVFREGQAADHWYLVRSGTVLLELETGAGKTVPVQTVAAGEALGCSWLLPPHRWRFDARAKDSVELIALRAEPLRRLLREDHEFGYQLFTRILKTVFGRLEATRFQLAGIGERPAKKE